MQRDKQRHLSQKKSISGFHQEKRTTTTKEEEKLPNVIKFGFQQWNKLYTYLYITVTWQWKTSNTHNVSILHTSFSTSQFNFFLL